jgi:cell division protein FtsW (lipid II flippase)
VKWSGRSYYQYKGAGLVLSFTLFGLAWMHIAQFAISWGNALGLIPVMGQPMTWISAATSHMMFFGLPTLVLALIGMRITYKENV